MLNRHALRAMRKRQKMTQQALAEAIGAYQQDISALECGRYLEVKTERLALLAAALGVQVEELIDTRRPR